jgi:hypothetical protein
MGYVSKGQRMRKTLSWMDYKIYYWINDWLLKEQKSDFT